jgi:hypothetical protein
MFGRWARTGSSACMLLRKAYPLWKHALSMMARKDVDSGTQDFGRFVSSSGIYNMKTRLSGVRPSPAYLHPTQPHVLCVHRPPNALMRASKAVSPSNGEPMLTRDDVGILTVRDEQVDCYHRMCKLSGHHTQEPHDCEATCAQR